MPLSDFEKTPRIGLNKPTRRGVMDYGVKMNENCDLLDAAVIIIEVVEKLPEKLDPTVLYMIAEKEEEVPDVPAPEKPE